MGHWPLYQRSNINVMLVNLEKFGKLPIDFEAMFGRCAMNARLNHFVACSLGNPRKRNRARTTLGDLDRPFLQYTSTFLCFNRFKWTKHAKSTNMPQNFSWLLLVLSTKVSWVKAMLSERRKGMVFVTSILGQSFPTVSEHQSSFSACCRPVQKMVPCVRWSKRRVYCNQGSWTK